MKTLYNSVQIKAAIKFVFDSLSTRRVAVVAFVGDEANAYLPKPNGIELYCWAKAGGTNPNAIRELLARGVNVNFVDSLHMKVYWSKKGVVITSANLSTYALGAGNLKEIGILLPSSAVDIDKVIASLKARPATDEEIELLEKGDKRIGRLLPDFAIPNSQHHRLFSEWYHSKSRPSWRMANYYIDKVPLSRKSKELLEKEHGNSSYVDIMGINKREYEQDDWILCYRVKNNKVYGISWMYVDHVVSVSPKDKKAFSHGHYQVIQVNKSKVNLPPFTTVEQRFSRAFKKAYQEFCKDSNIAEFDNVIPSTSVIDSIYKYYVG
jgi:hypothetical protein